MNLQFAFLVTDRDLNPALIAYECVKQNTACGLCTTGEETQGDMQGGSEAVLWYDGNTLSNIGSSRVRFLSGT